MSKFELRATIETFLIGGLGAAFLMLIGLPGGGLVGAVLSVAGVSLAGRKTHMPLALQQCLNMVVGAAAGSAVTPAIIGLLSDWPVSLLFLVVSTVGSFWMGYIVFRRIGDCSETTAFFAAAPGSLFAVMALAEDAGAALPRVVVAQLLRLATLAVLSPLALSFPVHGSAAVAEGMVGGVAAWLIFVVACLLAWLGARLLAWSAPAFLGPLLGSALVHVLGIIAVLPPTPVITLASIGLGATLGTRFCGVDHTALIRFLPSALAALLGMGLISLTAGWFAGALSGVGPTAGMLGFAPGSMDLMVAIAVTANANPVYVTMHHLVRYLGLVVAIPVLARRRARNGD